MSFFYRMLRPSIVATIGILAASAAGCGPRDAKFNPSHFVESRVLGPPDVVLRPGLAPGEIFRGIYVARPGDLMCCGAKPHVDLPIRKSRPGTMLEANVYIIEAPLFRRTPQRLRFTFPDGSSRVVSGLRPGMRKCSVAIPAALRNTIGIVDVKIDAAVDYVPRDEGDSNDPAHYGYLLLSIYFD